MKANKQDPFQTLFDPLKVEISDNGFSKNILKRLPEHNTEGWSTILFFGLIGVVIFIITGGASLLIEELLGLVAHIVAYKIPTPQNITAYLILVVSICYGAGEIIQSNRV